MMLSLRLSAPARPAPRRRPIHDDIGPSLSNEQGLLDRFGRPTLNSCQVAGTDITFEHLAEPTETQRRGFRTLGMPTSPLGRCAAMTQDLNNIPD
jgi:hypothetical protein